MIRTRKAPARFLSAMLCLVLMLGLLPMTAFAEGTREEVDTIKATAIINVPSYGEPTNYPAFTVTEGSPAHIATMMTHWEKKNTVTGKWDNVYSGDTFTEGTWRLSVQVRIDDEGGKTHKLSAKPRFFVNEVEWQIKSGPLFDDPHFVSLAYFHSQEYEVTSSTLPQMYDITVKNGVAKNVSYIDITKAKPGDKVVLLANDRRDEGLAFEKWVVTGATVDAENNMTAKFIMPEGNVTAEATYIPCDISIKAVKLTLGNYAVGKKASDISVKIITPDVVDFSYGDTYCRYDEGGVALDGSYVLCYLEGETIKRLGADELIKEGVEYFLEVHIKSDEGYTFLGLKEENVTLDGTAGGAMFMQPNNAVYSFLLKPLKTVDLTLDNYAVGNKAGDISVEITTPGVVFSGSGEYNQGYQIAIPDGEGIGGTITVRFLGPDEKLEAGADYDLFVFVKAADGSTLKDLAAANAKLDGKAAEAVDLLSDGVTAVIIFKLTPLEASHTHTYGTEWKSDAYKHWHECSCGAKSKEAAHTASDWITDTPATATTSGTKHKECTVCKRVLETGTIPATGSGGGGGYTYYTIKATVGVNGSISPSGDVSVREGRDQTFTITPDKGYAISNVKIDGKSIGAVKSYTFENVRRTHTIEVIFMKANGNPQAGVFVDVAEGSYYEEAIDWAVEKGITNGVSSNMFAPNDPCTRAQIVTFLWRAAGSPAPKRISSFTDVPADAFYAKAVAWAVENGITSGTGESKFSPNATCTRAQAVTFLYRASGSPAVSGSAEFSDVSATAFYADAVAWAAKKGITTGIGGGLFGADNDCTRGQIVTFLWRCKK